MATKKQLRRIFADNLNARMAQQFNCETDYKLELRSGIGHSTIDRARKAQAAISLDSLEALAEALDMEPWQMLVPHLSLSKQPSIARHAH